MTANVTDKVTCSVSGKDFARAVLAVEKSAARDDSRPVLAGILMEIAPPDAEFEANRMTLVASDGFRLSYAQLSCSWEPWEPEGLGKRGVIVRHKPLVVFARKAKSAPTVTIEPAPGGMWCFRNEKTQEAAIIPTIDGTYPDWRKITDDVVGDAPDEIATFNARYLCEAAGTAPPDAMLTIRRKAGKEGNPGVMAIREIDKTEVATHIIMPMVSGVVE
ncbi:MAG: hypothetical protein KC432_03655 [Thermomicrobiales bacterium]|nr:hypothetical protein [Thermomicrobiales bacterium]